MLFLFDIVGIGRGLGIQEELKEAYLHYKVQV